MLQDINMMGLGGTERTDKSRLDLSSCVGLKLSNMWRTEGSNFVVVVVEGRLKSA